jgi:hypothetical protein
MYNKEEIERNLRLLRQVTSRDFPNIQEENARNNIIRTNILAEFGLESLYLLKEDSFLKEAKKEIENYLCSASYILENCGK